MGEVHFDCEKHGGYTNLTGRAECPGCKRDDKLARMPACCRPECYWLPETVKELNEHYLSELGAGRMSPSYETSLQRHREHLIYGRELDPREYLPIPAQERY